jgi:AcrR family transcriptional regulator
VTENANPVIRSEPESDAAAESLERLDRVLDAAGELLVRWGYRRVTIEDVADRAGIGKGTVYLHFPTKEALFLTVLLRGYRSVVGGIVERMRADPLEVLPGRMTRSLFVALLADPVARPIYFGDTELLGRLAKQATNTLGPLRERGQELNRSHFQLLRDAGLLRTDRTLAEQHYLLQAVGAGFWFLEGFELPSAPADPAARAELQEYALVAALEPADRPEPTAELAETVARLYESLIDVIDEEWRRRVR